MQSYPRRQANKCLAVQLTILLSVCGVCLTLCACLHAGPSVISDYRSYIPELTNVAGTPLRTSFSDIQAMWIWPRVDYGVPIYYPRRFTIFTTLFIVTQNTIAYLSFIADERAGVIFNGWDITSSLSTVYYTTGQYTATNQPGRLDLKRGINTVSITVSKNNNRYEGPPGLLASISSWDGSIVYARTDSISNWIVSFPENDGECVVGGQLHVCPHTISQTARRSATKLCTRGHTQRGAMLACVT